MSPPAAAYMRPGAGLYIYIAGTGSCVHEPIHHIFRSFVGQHRKMGCCPLQNIEVLHLFRWYTHRQTDRQTNKQTDRHPDIHSSTHPSIHPSKQLSHTQIFHAYLSPSHVSFLPFPFRLHLSFVTYWKKLTCGVFRSFNSLSWSWRSRGNNSRNHVLQLPVHVDILF